MRRRVSVAAVAAEAVERQAQGRPPLAVVAAERALDGAGRVLLRPSGTEPLIRVMVEGSSKRKVAELAERIAEAVRSVR